MTRADMTVAEATQRWLDGRESRQELAASTVGSYRHHLASFVAHVGPDRPVADLDEFDFEDWVASLRRADGEPLKPAALNTRASTVRAFAGWAARRRLTPYDIATGVGRARVPHAKPKRLPGGVARTLLDVAHGRERTILLIGLHLGLRRAEICAMRLDHWDRGRGELLVMGKGSRERTLPVVGEVEEAMAEWVEGLAFGLPLRDLAMVALNDAGIGTWNLADARAEGWDPTAGTFTVLHRGRPKVVALDVAQRRLLGLYVRSLPRFGRDPGPLFPSSYHRKGGRPMVRESIQRQVGLTRAIPADGGGRPGPWFWPSNHRPGEPLAPRTLSMLVRKVGEVAQVAGLFPHQLRHSMASELVESGADLVVVRDLLGHSSLTTTSLYVSATAPRMREAMERRRYYDGLGQLGGVR